MPGRTAESGGGYRFGFNGMEHETEIYGEGNAYNFGARIYDSRIGKWLSVDPLQKKYSYLSTYNFVANNPILFIDPDGQKIVINEPIGSDNYIKLDNALKIFQKTHPLVYKRLDDSPINVNYSMGRLNKSNVYEAGYTESFDQGHARVSYEADASIKFNDGRLETWTTTEERNAQKEKGETVDYFKKVDPSEVEGKMLIIGDIDIVIDDEVIADKKERASVVGHESGHADDYMTNKARNYMWDHINDDPHYKGNPNGEYAKKVGDEVSAGYSKAKKQIKAENNEP